MSHNRGILGLVCMLAASVLLLVPGDEAQAQQPEHKWLDIGRYSTPYVNSGGWWIGRYRGASGGQWPYLETSTCRNCAYQNGMRVWIGAKDWTDETGQNWEYKIAYTETGNLGIDTYPQEFKLIGRFPRPQVTVDGRPSERVPVALDEVDSSLDADRKFVLETNTLLGITMTQEVHAFSQELHEDYHILHYTLTNTGNVDGDAEIELPDQTVNGVYFWYDRRQGQTIETSDVVGRGGRWGSFDMEDIIRDSDLIANISWLGHAPDFQRGWNPMGAPAIDVRGSNFPTGQDTTGKLHAAHHLGFAKVHADASATDNSDDPDQPVTQFWISANEANATGAPPVSIRTEIMKLHYEEWFTSGVASPYHAWVVEPSGDFAHTTANPDIVSGGVRQSQGYGPYTLAPGESVDIWIVEGVSGLGPRAALAIGRRYKNLWLNNPENAHLIDIEYDADGDGVIQDDERMDKNEWVVNATRDSLVHMFMKAKANFASGFNIPRPPRPPATFAVNSDVGGTSLEWTYPSGEPDPPGGFEIYRASSYFEGNPQEDLEYQLVAQLPGSARSHHDTEGVERGIDYFYFIQAVGDAVHDPTALEPGETKRLRSNRYYTQTYTGVNLLREPGETLADARVVPNPVHVGSSESIRYPGADKLAFLDIPGQSTIKIYTERGDLVKTIEHTSGTGDQFWDLQTDAQQLVVSGLYIAAITDNDTGDTRFIKFIVIR